MLLISTLFKFFTGSCSSDFREFILWFIMSSSIFFAVVPHISGASQGFIPTKNLFVKFLNDPTCSFGHVWVISALLLDWDIEELIRA